jgi:hypothetical protein
MPDESQKPEKKLIIDEDWKSQVQAEKDASREPAEPERPSAGAQVPLPPADLGFLVSTLYLQGAVALGLLPNPVTNKPKVQIDQAKHTIDTLAMLQQKTEGNRTPEESDELEAALHQLRMAYVEVSAQLGTKN